MLGGYREDRTMKPTKQRQGEPVESVCSAQVRASVLADILGACEDKSHVLSMSKVVENA